ncbi:hypothetical protein FDN13_13865 [Caloramator sp. E03]|uniref:hypothetical protein n=1 Tax=Caloramator sp. E03 TaxID=2576307 RepID=UPI001110EBC1|nr:hypothetical protein [Caloramator sp. E03]QCX34700.1 hypothetical protein FDN13_13865 [Caloramator sp. E03]
MLETIFNFLIKYLITRILLCIAVFYGLIFIISIVSHLIGAIFKIDAIVVNLYVSLLIFSFILVYSAMYSVKFIINLYQKNNVVNTYQEDIIEYQEDSNETKYYNDSPGIHHVRPHYVNGYERADGTYIDGYWRGGDNGYYRSNPDGDLSNNLKKVR